MSVRIVVGDCRMRLAELDAGSVQCCVTSPPYFGLRDYGHAGQIGLEPTPDAFVAEMVAVFREVRRVLRDDGTLWLNLGDSYSSGASGGLGGSTLGGGQENQARSNRTGAALEYGLAPKNLIGIPWRVAFALQQPYYSGTIKRVEDRVWLAAMLDAEGCLFIHKRKAGQHNGQGYFRQNDNYGPGVEICNTSLAVVERIASLVGKGSISTSEKGRHGRKQTLHRWNLRTIECRDFVREVYPFLIAKQQQARILYGCPSSGEKADAAHVALMGLHNGIETSVDFPAPPSMFEPGYYLRSDVIWAKSNPMPESVTDRPTKSHEYLFLLTKSATYYYDADAIAEPVAESTVARLAQPTLADQAGSDRVPGKTNGNMKAVPPRFGGSKYGDLDAPEHRTKSGNAYELGDGRRNKRTVWTVATQPFKGAHFATFPPALIEPCILAGSKAGNTVLDPFGGAGTTGLVADRLGRNAVLCELNPEYAAMAERRLHDDGGMLMQVSLE